MSDLGQIYALHPTVNMTALQLAEAYGLGAADYVVMNHTDMSDPAYIHLTERDDERYYTREILWGDNADPSTPLYDGRESRQAFQRRFDAGETDSPIDDSDIPHVGVF